MRTLKIALFALVWLALLASCATERRCFDKYPPVPVSADTVEIIKYEDRPVLVPMPADTVRDSIAVMIPCPELPATYKSDTAFARGKFATSIAWLEGRQLKIKLTMNDVKLAVMIDSAAITKQKTITVVQNIIVEKKVIPPFYRALLWVSIFLAALLVLIIFIALQRKP